MKIPVEKWQAISDLAQKRGVSDEARRKWRERGVVPGKWHLPLLEDAKRDGVDLCADDFLRFMGGAATPPPDAA